MLYSQAINLYIVYYIMFINVFVHELYMVLITGIVVGICRSFLPLRNYLVTHGSILLKTDLQPPLVLCGKVLRCMYLQCNRWNDDIEPVNYRYYISASDAVSEIFQ